MSDYQPHFVESLQLKCLCGWEWGMEPAAGEWLMLADVVPLLKDAILEHEHPVAAPLGGE